MQWATIPMTWAPFLLSFRQLIFIGASTSSRVSLCHSSIAILNRSRYISLMRLMAKDISHALIVIWWTEIHQINVLLFTYFDPTLHTVPHCLRKIRKSLVPRKEKEGKSRLNKGKRPYCLASPTRPSMPPPFISPGPTTLVGPISLVRLSLDCAPHRRPHWSVSAKVAPPRVRVAPRQLHASHTLNKPLFANFYF